MDQATRAYSETDIQPFYFTGTGGEYFRIWIVNLILSILTLGIYSAWAKVRTNRYFYGNTQLDNTGFDYHAKPLAILKGRLLAVALLLVFVLAGQIFPVAGIAFTLLLLLATPWIIWKSMQFNARMTSFRNVRFGFYGSLQDSYRYLLFLPLIPLLTALLAGIVMWFVTGSSEPGPYVTLVVLAAITTYLMVPFIQKAITGYYIGNHRYGQGLLQVNLSTKKYYLIYLCLFGWSILIFTAIILAAGVAMFFLGLNIASMIPATEGELPPMAMAPLIAATVFMYIAMLIAGVWIKAYLKAKIRNHVFNNIQLDNLMRLDSSITTGRLFRFYLVNILLMICTLGLAYPWIKVRSARLMASTTEAHMSGSLDQYVSMQQNRQSAIGDEIGEAFDVDANLDLAF
ncbi:MAG: YjgN family protein [Gammaproteobacteria bacterium]